MGKKIPPLTKINGAGSLKMGGTTARGVGPQPELFLFTDTTNVPLATAQSMIVARVSRSNRQSLGRSLQIIGTEFSIYTFCYSAVLVSQQLRHLNQGNAGPH